jgi:gas vesicle protein
LIRSTQDLSSKLTQALGDFGDRVRQTIQQAYQDMQTQLTAAIREAQKALVEEIRRRLNEATDILYQSRKTMEEMQEPLREATEALYHSSEQLSRSAQDLSSKLTQAISDFGERVRQTLQQAYQSMQTQLTAATGEAQKALSDAANSLAELRTNFESQMNTLIRQNEQLLQIIAAQDAEIKRLSKLLTFCLISSIFATTGIFILTLLFIRAH